ncbi:MAG: hypothetical protein J5722_07385, partial [Oscillospiraceae bacterium]|nr:hypothetical protein [Oscillospiraceae bacterium]
TLIEKEQKMKEEFLFTKIEIPNEGDANNPWRFPELTPRNVALAEAMIDNDSAYRRSRDKNAEQKGKYSGSTAYWMHQLKDYYEGKTERTFEAIIEGAVKAVDSENSTHLSSDGVGLKQITKRIIARYSENKEKLKSDLATRKSVKDLFCKISEITDVKEANRKNPEKKYNPRVNISFASKFCHYACFYLFEGKPEQDNFPIFDSVLSKAIQVYSWYFLGKSVNMEFEREKVDTVWKVYEAYCQTIDDIRNNHKEKISRNGFDHILWYYFKGRDKEETSKLIKAAKADWERRNHK